MEPATILKGFSIIVCCYNSSHVIEETLRHLAGLSQPAGYPLELVLVNNRSTDNTVALAIRMWERMGSPFVMRVIEEERPGLSFARDCGIKASFYDYLLFCDDDNRLNGDYLSVAAPVLESRPDIGVLGGFGTPDYESLPPYWPVDFYIYGSGPQAEESGQITYVHGAGIIVRREAFRRLEQAKFRFLLTDRKGDSLSSGGDYELCYAITLAGYIIWYEKRLTFRHLISADRVTREYCWKFIRESAPAIDVLDVYRYFLSHHGSLHLGFYLKQLKLIVYHGYKLYRSFVVRMQYKADPQIVFLEDFHMRFHKARIKCISISFFNYSRWSRPISSFKERLTETVPEEPFGKK